jgi:hypothetical protein
MSDPLTCENHRVITLLTKRLLTRNQALDGRSVNGVVFSLCNCQHQDDKNVVFNQINKPVALFKQLDFVAIGQATVQLGACNMGLVRSLF